MNSRCGLKTVQGRICACRPAAGKIARLPHYWAPPHKVLTNAASDKV
jgi:hypothetical protein